MPSKIEHKKINNIEHKLCGGNTTKFPSERYFNANFNELYNAIYGKLANDIK